MGALGDIEQFPLRSQNPHTKKWCVVIPIGASGATGTLLQGPPGIACAKSATGVYDVTGMPVGPAESTGKPRVYFGIYSPTPTVGCAVVTIDDFNAGTLTFATLVGVTKTEPASGDVITLFFEGESE
jgi:hypothetical protein